MDLALIGSFGMLLWATASENSVNGIDDARTASIPNPSTEVGIDTTASSEILIDGTTYGVAKEPRSIKGHEVQEEQMFFRERIRDLKWSVRVNCKTAEFMEVGLAKLELCTAVLGD